MHIDEPTRESCPYCHYIADPYFVIHMRHYFHCENCDLIFKGKKQKGYGGDLARYYENKFFTDFAYEQLDGSRHAIYSHILDVCENETRIGKLLDVGCGCGFFLKEAMDRGWNILGMDPSAESIALSQKMLGNRTLRGLFEEFQGQDLYDVITMINTLDHTLEPWINIQKAASLLRQQGLLFLRFPNGGLHSRLIKFFKTINCDLYFSSVLVFHEYSFTSKFIGRVLIDNGFSNITIKNSPASGGHPASCLLKSIAGIIALLFYALSGGKIFLGPSLEVCSRKASKATA